MDFLLFNDVSLLPKSGLGHLCENLNNIVGHGIWYEKYKVQNTQWLQLVSDIVTSMNSDTVLCACFGLYPSILYVTLLLEIKRI